MDNNLVVDGIDLADCGVIERGTFDDRGLPTGWAVCPDKNKHKGSAVIYMDQSHSVYVGGKLSPTLTAEAKKHNTTGFVIK